MPHLSVADASRCLLSIRDSLRVGRVESAHQSMDTFLDSIDVGVLSQIGEEVTNTISLFFPKRRKAILQKIDARFFKNGDLVDPGSESAIIVGKAKDVTVLGRSAMKPLPNTSPGQVANDVTVLVTSETKQLPNASLRQVADDVIVLATSETKPLSNTSRGQVAYDVLEASETNPLSKTSLGQVVKKVTRLEMLETPRKEDAASEILPSSSLLRRADRGPSHSFEDATSKVHALSQDMSTGFKTLSAKHIFQWATYYRDFVHQIGEKAIDLYYSFGQQALLYTIREQFFLHTVEIFSKGYSYSQSFQHIGGENYSITKSFSGLQRFLELPIDWYSVRASRVRSRDEARSLRDICSAMLGAILRGYGETLLGETKGSRYLPQCARSWLHYAGFLTYSDLANLLTNIEPGELRDGVTDAVLPVTRALDELVAPGQASSFAVPIQGECDWNARRLAITLLPPARGQPSGNIEVHSYLSASSFRHTLEEPDNRGVAAIVASLTPDLHEWVESHPELRDNVVNTAAEGADFEQQVERILAHILFHVSLGMSAGDAKSPIKYNFAKRFPLNKSDPARYYHVDRVSVRQLLQTFERQTGVRLWCSVRRSGKTTACFDLGTSTGESSIVSQTCLPTVQMPGAGLFYSKVKDAINDGKDIPDTFFIDVVSACAAGSSREPQRFVFVLDEYEILFDRLDLAAQRSRELRYTVVHPLLSQMVLFARENLIVLIGQRPNAHAILMEHNQLSPYVQQDPFPLFQHRSSNTSSEFSQLVSKILTSRVGYRPEFVDAIYAETGGHPFLTVNLLASFFGWLIEREYEWGRVRDLGRDDFSSFAADRLSRGYLSTAHDYNFFRDSVIREALSVNARSDSPWLHTVYRCLFQIATRSPREMMCTRAVFAEICERIGVRGMSPNELLTTASSANFFAVNHSHVWPKIPILARLCAATDYSTAY